MVALVKAAYEVCHATDIDYAVVGGRRSVAIMYRTMLFDDILDGETVSLRGRATYPTASSQCPLATQIDDGVRWDTAYTTSWRARSTPISESITSACSPLSVHDEHVRHFRHRAGSGA